MPFSLAKREFCANPRCKEQLIRGNAFQVWRDGRWFCPSCRYIGRRALLVGAAVAGFVGSACQLCGRGTLRVADEWYESEKKSRSMRLWQTREGWGWGPTKRCRPLRARAKMRLVEKRLGELFIIALCARRTNLRIHSNCQCAAMA